MIFRMLMLCTIGWFCFMTYLSHQSGKATAELSMGITKKIIEFFQLGHYNEIHNLMRKLAHPFVFSIFTILVLFMLVQKWNNKKILIFAITFMGLWAWIDEITKLLIPGRHFSWYDVLLNLLGVVIGILIFNIFNFFYKNNKK